MRKSLRSAADSSYNVPPAPTYILLAKASLAQGRHCHKISQNKMGYHRSLNARSTASGRRRRCKDLSLVTETLFFHLQSWIERTLKCKNPKALVPGDLARAVPYNTPILLRSSRTLVYEAVDDITKKNGLTQKYLPNPTSIDHCKSCTEPDLSRH